MLEHLEKNVCEIVRCVQRGGLRRYKLGSFSARDAKGGYIVVTSTSIGCEMLTSRDMIVMGLDVNVLGHISGLQPTSEASIHLIIYGMRKDAGAIVHIHSMYGATFALLNKPIPTIVYEVANLGFTEARIPVVPYGRPGTMELADSVVGVRKEAECSLLEKHGTVASDTRDTYEAYLKANYIEESAQLHYNVLAVYQGKGPEAFSQEELQCWEYLKEISFVDEQRQSVSSAEEDSL